MGAVNGALDAAWPCVTIVVLTELVALLMLVFVVADGTL
jgi:hypothetical protein